MLKYFGTCFVYFFVCANNKKLFDVICSIIAFYINIYSKFKNRKKKNYILLNKI